MDPLLYTWSSLACTGPLLDVLLHVQHLVIAQLQTLPEYMCVLIAL